MSNQSYNLFFNIKLAYLYSAPILHLLGCSFTTTTTTTTIIIIIIIIIIIKFTLEVFPKTGHKGPEGE